MTEASNKSVPPIVLTGEAGKPPETRSDDGIRRRAEETLSRYLRWAEGLAGRCAFRGHASTGWLLESSALRRLRVGQDVSRDLIDSLFVGYLDDIVNKIRIRFPEEYGQLSDLEIMAHLQHQGGATGLIDFTASPLVALYFACQSISEKDNMLPQQPDGKIYSIRLDGEGIREVMNQKLLEQKMDVFFRRGILWFWRPGHDHRRMVFQQSVFVFGCSVIDGHDGHDCFEIPAIDKPALLGLLGTMGVSERTLFSDFAGFADANACHKEYPAHSAEVYYNECINRAQKSPEAYYRRGVFRHSIRDYEGAIGDYSRSIDHDPDNEYVISLYARGCAKFDQKDREGAVKDWKKAEQRATEKENWKVVDLATEQLRAVGESG